MLNRAEFLFLGAVGAAVAGAAVAFSLDRPQSLIAKDARPVGAVLAARGMERKVDRDVVWERIGTKQIVYRRDSLRTAKNQHATVRLQDGSELRLDGESLIFLDIGDREMRIVFDHGTVGLTRAAATTGGKSMSVALQSAGGTVKIEAGTTLSAEAGVGKSLAVQVESGRAVLTTAQGKPTQLASGITARVSEARPQVELKQVEIRLGEPPDGVTKVLFANESSLSFNWEAPGLEGAKWVLLKAETGETLESRDISGGYFRLENIQNGSYRWRVEGIGEGNQLVKSRERSVTVARDPGIRLGSPADRSVLRFTFRAPLIAFVWSANPLALDYELQLSADPEFREIATREKTTDNRLSLRNIGEGEWFWRVRYRLPGREDEFESQPGHFFVEREKEPPAPALISPIEGLAVPHELILEKGLLFAWQSRPEMTRYQWVLERENVGPSYRGFQNESFFHRKETLGPGEWRFRVSLEVTRDDGSTNLVTGAWRHFTVMAPLPVVKKSVADVENPVESQVKPVASQTNGALGQTTNVVSNETLAASTTNQVPVKINPVARPPVVATSNMPVAAANRPPEKTNAVTPPPVLITSNAPVVSAAPNYTNGMAVVSNGISGTMVKVQDKWDFVPNPPPAGIALRWSPREAVAMVDGLPFPAGQRLTNGNHTVVLEKEGFLPLQTNLSVGPQERGELTLTLRRKRVQGEEIILLDGTRLVGRTVEQDRDAVIFETGGTRRRIERIDIESIRVLRDPNQ